MECRKLHLKGTRRYFTDSVTTTTTDQQPERQSASTKQPTQSTTPQTVPQSYNAWANGPPHVTDKQQTNTTDSFLFHQMQQMQQTQHQILIMLKALQCPSTSSLQGYHQHPVAAVPTTYIK